MATTYQSGTRSSGAASGRKSSKHSASRPTTPKYKKANVEVLAEQDDDMATSFLHFCAMCENQITMPSGTLYCSETCRQKDASSTMSTYRLPKSNPTSPNTSPPFGPVRDIIPQRSPTQRNPSSPFLSGLTASTSTTSFSSSSSSSSSASLNHKPSYKPEHPAHHRPVRSHQDSEAARYLRQFSTTNLSKSSDHPRAYARHARPLTSTTSTIPSLSHSPTSNASSLVSDSPPPSSRPQRPTMPHRSSNLSFAKRKSIDLVTPMSALHSSDEFFAAHNTHDRYIRDGDHPSMASADSERTITFASLNLKATPTTAPAPDWDIERLPSEDDADFTLHAVPAAQTYTRSRGAAHGSLKQFFDFDGMRRAPR